MWHGRRTIYSGRWALRDKCKLDKNNIVNAYTMLFVDKNEDSTIYVTYLFCASRFPKDGWLQCCFHCGRNSTSDSYEFEITEEETMAIGSTNKIAVYVCRPCRNTTMVDENSYKELKRRVGSYINRIIQGL